VKAIYEESSDRPMGGPASFSVTVLKAEVTDAPQTPRYLVVLVSLKLGEQILPHADARSDADCIRWAQAEYDTLYDTLRARRSL
jgi:hypothetical protein